VVSRDPVERFIESGESYCSFIDAAEIVRLGELRLGRRRLADLYVAACSAA
jgi:hypothetical protein